MSEPLVSICCLTYNHLPFIEKCLDGFLLQKTSFPVEIIVHDDASTDGTQEIIKRFETNYPEIFRVTYETENKYSHGYKGKMDTEFCYKIAKGKYIAYCEGDDYWTDPLKLQKQVDFLESHPEYSVTFHRCKHFDYKSGKISDDACGDLFPNDEIGVDITIDMFFKKWITQPLTMVYRASMSDLTLPYKYKYYRDQHQIYHLLKAGNGRLMNFVGGVYVLHEGGIASIISNKTFCDRSLPIDKEFYMNNPNDNDIKGMYINTLKQCISVYSYLDKSKSIKFCFELFSVEKSVKHFVKSLFVVAKAKIIGDNE